MTAAASAVLMTALRESQLLEPAHLEEIQRTLLPQYAHAPELALALVADNWLTAYQVEELLQGRGPGLLLGAYRILEPIGQGGMGQVFKAEQRRLNRTVALKVIHHDCLANNREAIRRFRREAQAAAQLSHPNTIIVYDADQVGDTHFIVMEYVEGIDLARLVKHFGRLPIQAAYEFIRQAALGLQHAHDKGLVHRDVKPSNLLIARPPLTAARRLSGAPISVSAPVPPSPTDGPDAGPSVSSALALDVLDGGVVKILDLGLARLMEFEPRHDEAPLTQAGRVMGTPDYIAPEQARDPRGVDGRADIYSLGCTFYFLLTGRPPFVAETTVEKLLMHQLDEAEPVEQLRPETPPGLAAIIRKMMEKQPAQRYQTALEVCQALAAVAAVNTPVAAEAPAADGGRPPSTDVCMVSLVSPVPDLPPSPIPQTAEIQTIGGKDTDVAQPAGPRIARRIASLHGHTGCAIALAFAPDRNTLASGGVDGTIRVWDFSDGNPRQRAVLKVDRGEPQVLAFSPDQRWLAHGTSQGWLGLWNLSRPMPELTTQVSGHIRPVTALAFAPDGQALASGGGGGKVRLWDVAAVGLRSRLTLSSHTGGVTGLAFAPDGQTLASSGQDGTLRLWGLRRFWNKEQALLQVASCPVASVAFAPTGRLLATGCLDQTFQLWELREESIAEWARFPANHGGVQLVLFPPAGRTLLTLEEKGRATVWELASGQRLQEWAVPAARVYSWATTHDGRYLAAGASDGSVSVYRIASKRRAD